jgi:hypothetical protein
VKGDGRGPPKDCFKELLVNAIHERDKGPQEWIVQSDLTKVLAGVRDIEKVVCLRAS